MANKAVPDATKAGETATHALSQLQEAGLGNMVALGTAWVDALNDMGAEVAGFVADRIKEDMKTQHEIMHCKNIADLQHIQAQFVQRALDQYQAETGKLVEMGTKAFQPNGKSSDKKS